MLVLSRKVDQKITIGDDVVLTVVRIDSHRVRIGIEAPKDIRILRGELSPVEAELHSADESSEGQLSEREFAFAHPQPPKTRAATTDRFLKSDAPQLFAGTVSGDGRQVQLKAAQKATPKRAPLAGFVSAT